MFNGLMQSLGLRRNKVVLSAPIAGTVMPLSEVKDSTFSAGLLGEGIAISPIGNRVVAPADAKIESIFPSGYAVALHTFEGLDVLIHVGLDTVSLNGEHFRVRASQGETVKRGDVLIEFDRDELARKGLDLTVPILIRNALEFSSLKSAPGEQVNELDELIVARPR